jgi:transposase
VLILKIKQPEKDCYITRAKKSNNYLNEINEGITDEKDRIINCYSFTPNAPDQNPVEDVWPRGKNFLRKHFYESEKFHQMKRQFINYLDKKIFNFRKLEWYLEIQQPV